MSNCEIGSQRREGQSSSEQQYLVHSPFKQVKPWAHQGPASPPHLSNSAPVDSSLE
jgi:hypothetical protein